MSRLVFWARAALIAVSLCAAPALSQTPPPAAPVAQPAPSTNPAQPPAPTASPIPAEPVPTAVPADPALSQPAPAAPAAAPAPAYAPPPPAPTQRYEGQVSPDGDYATSTTVQGADLDEADENGEGDGDAFEMPPISVRLDPFNWLLQGRLPLEIEVGVWKLLSVELVPEFVTSEDPPLRDFSSYEDGANQYSNGLGDLSGASLGLGVWLDGEPFEGYVIRAILTNYGYEYKSSDSAGTIDSVTRTTRRFGAFFGSYRRWAFFTIGGGIGLSYELNQQERCGLRRQATSDGARITADPDAACDGELQVALDRDANTADDANGFLHPFYIDARFSLGFVID
jgi:hypothetical protein